MSRIYIKPAKESKILREVITELVNQFDEEVLTQIKFKKVVLQLQDERLEIYGKAAKYLRKKGLEEVLVKLIKARVNGLKSIECRFNYFEANRTLRERLEDYWEELVQEVKSNFSMTNGWLLNAKWQIIDKQKLMIEIKNKLGIEKLRNKKCDQLISELIADELGSKLQVEFELGDFSAETERLAKERQKENDDYIKSLMAAVDSQAPGGSKKNKASKSKIVMGKKIKSDSTIIKEIQNEERSVTLKGQVIDLEVRELRSGRNLIIFALTDTTDSITAKVFEEKDGKVAAEVSKGDWLIIRGRAQIDKYTQELTVMPRDINRFKPEVKTDDAQKKRIELHLHTKMSAMDSVVDVGEVINRADEWGHSAIAITDHGVVQAFPEAYNASQGKDIKVIYGLEAYLVDDGEPIILNPIDKSIMDETFVVFDLETTGFNPHNNEIIEIGAVKLKEGEVVESYQTFINPRREIPDKITELTGITNDMVVDAPKLEEVIDDFLEFIGDHTIVAHNLSFDLSFIEDKLRRLDRSKLTNPGLDTLNLSRALLPEMKSHKLNKLADRFNKTLDNHHRASDDAQVTGEILLELIALMEEEEITNLIEINQLVSEIDHKRIYPHHTTILVKNQKGLKNLYKLVSKSHIDTFYKKPRILKSDLLEKRKGLIIGSACEAGQLYKAVLNGKPDNELEKLAKFYDYLELQPVGNNKFLLEKGEVDSLKDLKEINHKIYQLGKKLGKPVVAAGDVHFLDPKDSIYRQILMEGQGFDDAADQAPLYFRTTDEMLDEFSYFDEEVAKELVIDNPKKIANMTEEIEIIPDQLFTPTIEGADEEVRNMAYEKAKLWYGDPLPELVEKRLERELNSIIGNGYAVIYLTSQKLVKKSLDDGYLVGSRGSVGSSFAATMTDITEVNPLPPHYRCPECKHSEFITDGSIGVGVDLKDKDCPECGVKLIKDGYDIPFEVFLGFEGDKVPDIDLNFSGEYQPEVHKYTETLFGKDYVYRAGTISTIANRTAYGFVKGYADDNGLILRKAETTRLVSGCTGVRRTTGQHPGGQIVVPQDKEIYDFTPVQKPANDMSTDTLTTHFDFHSIHDNLLKLDILGHDDPTSIRMLQDITGIDPQDIPLDDPDTMAIFSGLESLGVTEDDIGTTVGTLGIPEFGTSFVRQMLEDTRPTTFAELVRISGLSHGTDVWLNNAQDLIKEGTAELAEVISVRDDIMNYLIQKGVEPNQAFWIMEHVRKGKGLTEEEEAAMIEQDVPQWYIKSCKTIKYMFPKAHAVAYVMMAFRIAYFKVHHPEAFYNTYFTIKADDFDAQIVIQGEEFIKKKITEIRSKGNDATQKDKNTLTVLEIVIEAMQRGIEFTNVHLYDSKINEFKITDEGLRPPLITLQGLGSSAAESIIQARNEEKFTSIEDLSNRASVSKTVIEVMKEHGCLEGLPETNQLSLFG